MNKEGVYKFNFDCGRQGELAGVFISTKEKVDYLIKRGIEVSFGEVLGKHSDIAGPIDENEITLVSEDENVIKILLEHDLLNGFNPFNYYSYGFEIEGVDTDDMTVGEIVDKLLDIENEK